MTSGFSVIPLAFIAFAAGCTTLGADPRPEFSQRAAPKPRQEEIELLAGIDGSLAIEGGCLGVETRYEGKSAFSTVVWPWNSRLEQNGGRWQVVNTRTAKVIRLGDRLRGGGGHIGEFDEARLGEYNGYLARDLSPACAAKGIFTLNEDFRPG